MALLRFSISLSVIFAVSFLSPAHAADRPMPATFEVKGVKLRYYVAGKGEPAVFLHGYTSSSEMNWILPGLFGAVANDHQAIALDFPGHGGSEKPEKEEAYGDQLVEDVVALLDHLKIDKAHIVGYSMGGMVAVKMLAKYPERTLSGTIGGMGWLRDGSMLQKLAFGRKNGDSSSGAMALCYRGMGKLGVTESELKSITVPVEILVGDHDPCKKMYVAPLQTVRTDWPVVEIEDAGHIACVTKKPFKDGVVAWIAKQTKK
jgi:pimeloyl-ACP methyl ester carboxylesterase